MSNISRFFSLPPNERIICLRLLLYILRAELIFAILPYHVKRRYVFTNKPLRRLLPENPKHILRRHITLLTALCLKLPWRPTCLRQAAALRDALAAAGIDSSIKIGISKSRNKFNAHAWLECCGLQVLKNGAYNELAAIDKEEKDAKS